MEKHLYIYEKLNLQQTQDLLEFAKKHSTSIELSRYVTFDLDEDVQDQVNQAYLQLVMDEDRLRRERFQNDEKYQKELLEIYENQEEIEEFFNLLLQQDLDILLETDELDEEEEDFTELSEDLEIEDIIETIEDLEMDFEQEYQQPEFDMVDYPESYFEKKQYMSERLPILSQRYTRNSHVTRGPIFEITRFYTEDVYALMLEKLKSLYTFPLLIDDYLFEDPAFLKKERALLSICSHEGFTYLVLDEEEYQEFLTLNINHI